MVLAAFWVSPVSVCIFFLSRFALNPTAQMADRNCPNPINGDATALTPRMYSSSSTAYPFSLTCLNSLKYKSVSTMELSVNRGSPFDLIILSACSSAMDARKTLPTAPANRGMVEPIGAVILSSCLDSTMSRMVTWPPFRTPRKTDVRVFSISSSVTGLAEVCRSI